MRSLFFAHEGRSNGRDRAFKLEHKSVTVNLGKPRSRDLLRKRRLIRHRAPMNVIFLNQYITFNMPLAVPEWKRTGSICHRTSERAVSSIDGLFREVHTRPSPRSDNRGRERRTALRTS